MAWTTRDIGALIKALNAFPSINVTAGGAGDNTPVNGNIIDRLAYADLFMSGKICIPFTTTLGAAETLKLDVKVQDGNASNLSDAADYGTPVVAQTVATGPGGGGTVLGIFELDVDFSGAGRYIRVVVNPNISTANTDTARVGGGTLVVGGGNELPAV